MQSSNPFPPRLQMLVAVAFFPILLIALSAVGGGFSMPAFFAAAAGVALTVALALLWHSLRGALSPEGEVALAASDMLPERAALLEEKMTLLRAIKDIAYERGVGKISEDDFARLDAAYRRRAREVLRALDADIEPFLERAERLVRKASDESAPRGGKGSRKKRPANSKPKRKKGRQRQPEPELEQVLAATLPCPSCGVLNDDDARHCKACGEAIGTLECPDCGTDNDADARFCKSCGGAVGAAAAASSSTSTEARVGAGAATAKSPKSGSKKRKARSAKARSASAEPAAEPSAPEPSAPEPSAPEPVAAAALTEEEE